MLTIIRWLVKHWLPGYVLIPKNVHKATVHMPDGFHIHRNPTRKPKLIPVFEDGELVWKEGGENDTKI
jgi:hypothetical protein